VERAEGKAGAFDALPKAPEPAGAPTGATRPTASRPEEAASWSSVAAAARELEAERRGASSAGPLDRAGDVPAVPLAQAEAGVAPTAAPGPEGAVTARRIARQIVDQPVLRTGGATELSLYPEELGHLRLTVEGTDGNLRVIIEAARPETADLMRRHVETLRQELRQEGLGSVGVSIGGGEARRDDGSPARRSGEGGFGGPGQVGAPSSEAGPSAAPGPAARSRAAGGHLDIRF
jgi:flagellar hook-length control protein FliK